MSISLTELNGDHCLTSGDIEHAIGMWEAKVERLKEELLDTRRILLALILSHPDKQLEIPMNVIQKVYGREKDYTFIGERDARRGCYILTAGKD